MTWTIRLCGYVFQVTFGRTFRPALERLGQDDK